MSFSCGFLCFPEISPSLFPAITDNLSALQEEFRALVLCVVLLAGFFPMFVAVGSSGKETNTGFQLACNPRFQESGKWRVDVAMMGQTWTHCVHINALALHWSAVVGSDTDLWPLTL